jgi:uncharacterized protein (TIGR02145 family)
MKQLLKFLFILIVTAAIINGCEKDKDDPGGTITDVEGNVYKTVKIGSQVWMAENLKTTKFNDNSAIPNVSVASSWEILTTPGYSWYNNDIANKDTMGAMYNWYAANRSNICPSGWSVPSDSDFIELELHLGLPQNEIHTYGWHGTDQGSQMKSTSGWIGGDGKATNSSKFSALPGGYRQSRGLFSGMGLITFFWTADDDAYNNKPTEAWYRRLDATETRIYKGTSAKAAGNYIRCLQD